MTGTYRKQELHLSCLKGGGVDSPVGHQALQWKEMDSGATLLHKFSGHSYRQLTIAIYDSRALMTRYLSRLQL